MRPALVAWVLLLLVGGCDASRLQTKPTVVLQIEVLGGGEYRHGGQIYDREGIEEQLRILAEQGRHPATGVRHRTHVHIEAPKGSANADARAIGSHCQRVGLPIVVYIPR